MLGGLLEEVSLRLDYTFQKQKLLEMALLHPSLKKKRRSYDFERLEFLGDRILGLIIAEQLFIQFSQETEGDLAKRLAVLVNKDTCLEVAHKIKLDKVYDHLGAEEGAKPTILADAMEAIIGAIYLDGGLESAQAVIQRLWQNNIKSAKKPPKDHKSSLQEWSQKLGYGVPKYKLIEMTGPAHAPHFIIEVRINDFVSQAEGASKRVAEQEAARLLLEKVSQ